MSETIRYCPVCGSELEAGAHTLAGWVECPEHGKIHVEYYQTEDQ